MEDFFVLKNIITQGFRGGFMSIKSAKVIKEMNMVNGRWLLADGADLGSSWDIILNPEFAEILWKDDYKTHLREMVLMSHIDRVNYLHQFVKEDEAPVGTKSDFIIDYPDGLMDTIKESLLNINEYSEGLYVETCNSTYGNLLDISKKTSVTSLSERDFLMMNAMDNIMGGGLSQYFTRSSKPSFSTCPECGKKDFQHEEDCTMKRKSDNFLLSQNDGC
jgi:hypothetical protein